MAPVDLKFKSAVVFHQSIHYGSYEISGKVNLKVGVKLKSHENGK